MNTVSARCTGYDVHGMHGMGEDVYGYGMAMVIPEHMTG